MIAIAVPVTIAVCLIIIGAAFAISSLSEDKRGRARRESIDLAFRAFMLGVFLLVVTALCSGVGLIWAWVLA